jgi:4'-phosphopantetheinyl transferase
MHGLEDFGLDTDLEKIVMQKNGKPGLADIYFNISHTGHQVGCAFSKEGKLGFDMEQIKPIQFEDFTAMFSAKEWKAIKNAKDPLRTFYWFWTRKESIIKADGLSLGDLHRIELDVSADRFISHGKCWYLRELDLGDEFFGGICCEEEIGDLMVERVDVNILSTINLHINRN